MSLSLQEMVEQNLVQAALRLKATEDELARLRDENARLREDRDSLLHDLAVAESMIEETAQRP